MSDWTDREKKCTEAIIRLALAEDVGEGDVTTESLVDDKAIATVAIVSKEPCVVAGLPAAREVFEKVNDKIEVQSVVEDGSPLAPGDVAIELNGPAAAMLTAERTALNFLQRLSGIATLTRAFVDAVKDQKATILDTRKTTPGWRALEKYAVRCGGGTNHRMGLYDAVMIKDNHRAYCGDSRMSLADAITRCRKKSADVSVEVEVETREELEDALLGNPDWILLDNMPPERMKEFVSIIDGSCKVEASGGVTLDTVAGIAATGVDAISVGFLTHSARAVDFSLEWRR